MEPRCGFEPVLSAWMDWESTQYPQLAPAFQTSKLLMSHGSCALLAVTGLFTRSWFVALQMYCAGASLAQRGWLHVAVNSEVSDAAEAPQHTTETRKERNSQDIDDVFSSLAA
jgi:hypothetical protein